jgi:phosphoribosylformylglycinamidine (FGAM) synthase PurS component
MVFILISWFEKFQQLSRSWWDLNPRPKVYKTFALATLSYMTNSQFGPYFIFGLINVYRGHQYHQLDDLNVDSSILASVARKPSMLSKFLILVNIENKPYIDDPEGETIRKDLIIKGGYSSIESVRSVKTLKIIIRSSSERNAIKTVKKLCHDLRIYNPILSDCTVSSSGYYQS